MQNMPRRAGNRASIRATGPALVNLAAAAQRAPAAVARASGMTMRDVYLRQLERRAAASDARAAALTRALQQARSDLLTIREDVLEDAPVGWLWYAFYQARVRIEAALNQQQPRA